MARARAGWSPPGPMPPGDGGDPALRPGPDETLDAFAGHWKLFQLRAGHRYSTDDVLAAWFAVDTVEALGRSPNRALDLGTGIGSVGLFLLWCFPDLHLTGVEFQPESLALALRSARYNGVADRAALLHRDLRDPLADLGSFDLVTGSPPYWDPGDGRVSTAPQKGPCRFEFRGGVEAYCSRAAEVLAPGGFFALVFDGRQRDRLLAAAGAADLATVRIRDVISRAGDPPLLVLAAFAKGAVSNAALESPPLTLRDGQGHRTPEFRALRERMGLPPGPR